MNSARLTSQEDRVARLYAEGFVGKEIADRLHISYRTVVNHTQNIYEKTGIPRCTNAISTWWLCREFGLTFDLAPIVRNAVATVMLAVMSLVMVNPDDSYIRFRRSRVAIRRNECVWQTDIEC